MTTPHPESHGATRTFAGEPPQPTPAGVTVSGSIVDATQSGHLPPGDQKGASEPPVLEPGAMLNQYRIEAKLGQGGMGAVYKALQVRLGKHVALKVLPPHLTRDPAVVARFDREMKAVGKLEHPHIVRAMDAGEVGGIHYLVMEYVEGLDLSQLVRKKGPRPVLEACELVRQAAVGLAHAHENGLIHRDIKPSNLLLTRQGKLKILDLGLARLQGSGEADSGEVTAGLTLTANGVSMGTPDYMAPEQWDNTHNVDGRVDLYALGCTLFFLLAGRAPFEGERFASIMAKMKAHALEPIPDLTAARSEVPDELATLYRQLLAKEPAERSTSAAEVAKNLAGIIRSLRGGAATVQNPQAELPTRSDAEPNEELKSAMAALSLVTEPRRPIGRPTQPVRKPPSRLPIALAGGLAAIVLLAGIIITIRNRDGSTTKVEVPDGATVEVSQNGKPLGTFPAFPSGGKPGERSPRPAASGATTQSASASTDADPQRAAALAVLEAGGSVTVGGSKGGRWSLYQTADLPKGPFFTDVVYFDPNSTGPFDRVCAQLEKLPRLHSIADGKLTDADVARLAGLDLRSANFSKALTDKSADVFAQWQNAVQVRLDRTSVGDATCRVLARLPVLERLSLAGTQITDAGLAEFARHRNLTWLVLSKCQSITHEGIASLCQGPPLAFLDLSNCPIGDEVVEPLSTASHIRVIRLTGTKVSAEGARKLQQALPRAYIYHSATRTHPEEQALLQWIWEQGPTALRDISNQPITKDQSDPLPIGSLTFAAQSPHASEAVRIGTARGLLEIEWPNLQQADKAMEGLSQLDGLRKLVLAGSDLSGDGLAQLAPMRRLAHLHLPKSLLLDDAALEKLPAMPSLQTLDLSGAPISGSGLKHLARTPNLQELILRDCKNLDSSGLSQLPPLPRLRFLFIYGPRIDDEAAAHLSRYPGLHQFQINATKVTAEGVARLHEALPLCAISWDGGLVAPEKKPR